MNAVPGYLDNVAQLRVPPHSVPAEQSVLGALLLVGESLAQIRDQLAAEDFYRREHQLIYQGICGVADLKREVDVVTVGDWITANVEIGAQELVATIYDLAGSTPSAANVRAYAEIVRNKALLRQLIETTTDIADSAYGASDDEAERVVSASATKLASLTVKSSGNGGLVMVRSGVQKAWDEMEARFHGEGTQGLVPKWSSVRRKIPYLEPTDLMVLGARPSMGKTAHALNWAEDAAAGGRNVAAFSLEMSASQWSLRLMAAHAGVDLNRMREKGALNNDEWARLSQARNYIQSLPLAIDDCGALSVDALAARASRMHAKVPGGLGLIVVDYLQLLTGKAKSENRNDEVSYISRRLKGLAKELNCPVMALSQLNRSVEKSLDKRPGMADLRESGAIEQDADVIAFLYRDDYYSKEACGAPGISELIVAKNRQGETGTCYLQHRLQCSAFDDYTGPRPNYTIKGTATAAGGYDEFDMPKPRATKKGGKDRSMGDDA
ncbi:replicative DNA helicase [Stenotrophomonas sp. MH181796]|uniref:replicative DNA helicase n=1 Tax=Stenotrophomonas sp. MH181796 TaxID=2339228 RepID=UPI00129D16C8|nr:replicative DNA helicase [Stenotrophomonas sp. MH181796]MRI41709.1 replicative DNA helicase [Stenotrophomonas sp. MH181796]